MGENRELEIYEAELRELDARVKRDRELAALNDERDRLLEAIRESGGSSEEEGAPSASLRSEREEP